MAKQNSSISVKECEIREMQYNNPSDPQLFLALFDFCDHYMRWRNWNFPEFFKEELCTDLAEQMYFRIQSKGPIDNLVAYLQQCRRYCMRLYYEQFHTYYELPRGSAEEEVFLSSFCDTHDRIDTMRKLESFGVIESIPKVVETTLENNSKYYPDTKEWLNAYLSLLISLVAKEFVSYSQTEQEKMYTNMLYRKLYDVLKDILRDSSDIPYGELSLLQLYTLSVEDQFSED